MRQLGVFLDGSRLDLNDEDPSSITRLARAYAGPTFYRGGPGTYLGTLGYHIGGWFGFGLWGRIRDALHASILNPHDHCDAFGYSRGGDGADEFAWGYRKIHGKPVRFLGLIDPVRARGFSSVKRVIPGVDIPTVRRRPPCGRLALVRLDGGPRIFHSLDYIDLQPCDFVRIYGSPYTHHTIGRWADPANRILDAAFAAGVEWRSPMLTLYK